MPRAILLDWDSTLVDNWDSINAATNVALKHFGHAPISRDESIARSSLPNAESFLGLFGEDWQKGQAMIYETLHSPQSLENMKVLPHTIPLLDRIRELAIPMGVVSNKKGVMIRREIDYLGWQDYFAVVVGSGDAAYDKPHPAPVHYALETLGVPPGPDVWMVGDMHSDMEAAGRAGVTPILMETTARLNLGLEGNMNIHPPALRVKDANALGELVGELAVLYES